MDTKIDIQKLRDEMKKDMGLMWYWYSFTGWVSDHTIFIQDLWWWLTDGKAYWSDAVPCERKLCSYCGNKPF